MRTKSILLMAACWLIFFVMSKVVFAFSCGEATIIEVTTALWHGLPMDLSTTAYMLAIPLLAMWISVSCPYLPFRHILITWHILCAALASAAIVADCALYPFWQFKLDATILNYLDSPSDAFASVSAWFVIWHILLFIMLSSTLSMMLYIATAKHIKPISHRWHFAMPVWFGLLFVVMRGGVSESTMNVGVVYHSQRIFLNHVAVNPLFGFLASLSKSGDFALMYNILPENERHALFSQLYPPKSKAERLESKHNSSILNQSEPNVLIIMWESGGGMFYAPLGGTPDVMVNLERLAAEGICFSNLYNNSWRTDRGMVSALSGWFAYPTLTLMRLPVIADRLPCLGRSFASQGYDTFFMYGGDINFTHTAGYLTAGGYKTLVSDKDFTIAERHTNDWGVQDEIMLNRLYDEVVRRTRRGQKWHGAALTLSSHPPFKVPYNKHEDEVLNSMAYTDHCIGKFVDSLRSIPEVWQNLLIVILPDHGFPYNMNETHPLFFRAPMVWTGGAINRPMVVDKVMNQSDMPATLLGALGVKHDDYPYSRDVLDSTYTNPFAYCTSTEIAMFVDTIDRALFNVKTLTDMEGDTIRQKRLKAILQTSYDILE